MIAWGGFLGTLTPMPSGWEWIIVAGVVLLLFGGAKLPKLARSLGEAKKEFEQGVSKPASSDEAKAKPAKDDAES
jgi:sec-independent protein translocase protein TatA